MTSLSQMFYGCSFLTDLNTEGWQIAEETDLSDIFEGCPLSEEDLQGFQENLRMDEDSSVPDSESELKEKSEVPDFHADLANEAPVLEESGLDSTETEVPEIQTENTAFEVFSWCWNTDSLDISVMVTGQPTAALLIPAPGALVLKDENVTLSGGIFGSKAVQKGNEIEVTLSEEALKVLKDSEKGVLNFQFELPSDDDPVSWSLQGIDTLLTKPEDPEESEQSAVSVQSLTDSDICYEAAAQKLTISQLKEKYPHGYYWTHLIQPGKHQWVVNAQQTLTGKNDACTGAHEGVTKSGVPANNQAGADFLKSSSGYTSNSFDGYPFCDGFARLLFNKYHGFSVGNVSGSNPDVEYWVKSCVWSNKLGFTNQGANSLTSANSSNLKIGDFVSIDQGSYSHSAFVTSVSSDSFTVANANMDLRCRIEWGRKFSYKDVFMIARPRRHFTVQYKANGGSGTMASTSVPYGITTATRKSTFTRNGYHQTGWNVYIQSSKCWLYTNGTSTKGFTSDEAAKKEGYTSKSVYSNGVSVSKTSSVNGDTVEFRAIWKPNTFTIKYNANGGSGSMKDTKHTYGVNSATAKNAFTRSGYTFKCWRVRKSDGSWSCVKRDKNGTITEWKDFKDLNQAQKKDSPLRNIQTEPRLQKQYLVRMTTRPSMPNGLPIRLRSNTTLMAVPVR